MFILKSDPKLKDQIVTLWKSTHPGTAPATMWHLIAEDYIKTWKIKKKQDDDSRDLTAAEYLSYLRRNSRDILN
jgi:hypothetical protein